MVAGLPPFRACGEPAPLHRRWGTKVGRSGHPQSTGWGNSKSAIRAGLHTLTEGDHQAVRELTRHLDAATVRQVASRLERTRSTALALAAGRTQPTRPGVRRSHL